MANNNYFFTDTFIFNYAQLEAFIRGCLENATGWLDNDISDGFDRLMEARQTETPLELPIRNLPPLCLEEIRTTDWGEDLVTEVVQAYIRFETGKMIIIMDPYACGALSGYLFEQVPLLEDDDPRKAPLLALLNHLMEYIEKAFDVPFRALSEDYPGISAQIMALISEKNKGRKVDE